MKKYFHNFGKKVNYEWSRIVNQRFINEYMYIVYVGASSCKKYLWQNLKHNSIRHDSPCFLRLTSWKFFEEKFKNTWLTLYSEIDKLEESEENSRIHGSPCILRLTSLKNLRKIQEYMAHPVFFEIDKFKEFKEKNQYDMAHPVFWDWQV